MNIDKLYDFVREFYGYKIEMLFINETENSIGGILYDSFLVKCFLSNDDKIFSAGICYGNSEQMITELFGKKCLTICDEKLLQDSLRIIDNYCRLRLPDKFLDAHYKAYVLSQYEDCDM